MAKVLVTSHKKMWGIYHHIKNIKMEQESNPNNAPTFEERHGKGRKGRRFTVTPDISDTNVDFALPEPTKVRVETQKYQIIRVAAPENTRVKCTEVAVLFGPCFATEAEARQAAVTMRDEDPRFTVDVIEMYNFLVVPKRSEIKQFIEQNHTQRYLTNLIKGQQQAMLQHKKETELRMARDREKAQAEMRKRYGDKYVSPEKPTEIKEHEEARSDRDDKIQGVTFTAQELISLMAQYVVQNKNCGLDPKTVGGLLRFLEGSKVASTL